jgi:hypothetical protein
MTQPVVSGDGDASGDIWRSSSNDIDDVIGSDVIDAAGDDECVPLSNVDDVMIAVGQHPPLWRHGPTSGSVYTTGYV